MRIIKKYYNFINESLLDKMKGKSKEDVWKPLGYNKTFDTCYDFMNYILNNMKVIKTYHNILGIKRYDTYGINDKELFKINYKLKTINLNYNNIVTPLDSIFNLNYDNICFLILETIGRNLNCIDYDVRWYL